MTSLPIDLSALGTDEKLLDFIEGCDMKAIEFDKRSGFSGGAPRFVQFLELYISHHLKVIAIAFRTSREQVFFSDPHIESTQNHFHLFVSRHTIVNSITQPFG